MSLRTYPRLGETLESFTAPCGLPVKILKKPGFSRKIAYFVTDFGSINRDFILEGKQYHTPAGVAHFLEHKMFELPDRDVTAEFAAQGASVNAFTSYDMTAYYFNCTENFQQNLKLLLEFVSTPYFPADSVLREMGIIDQEIGMNLDAPDSQIFDDLVKIAYASHPVRVPILGSSQSIREITPEILYLCHRAFYTPKNMVLCIAGDVDSSQVRETVDRILGTEEKPAGEKIPMPEEKMTVVQPLCRRAMEVAMTTCLMLFKCEPTGKGPRAIRQEIVADLAAEALFGESSPLYLKLYEQGLIDSSFGGGFDTLDGCAMVTVGSDTENPEALRDAIIARAAEIAETGVAEADFLRMKRSAMGRRIRDLDSFDGTCFRLCAYYFGGFDYFEFPGVYADIRPEEVRRFLETVVTGERCALSVIDPIENKEEAE